MNILVTGTAGFIGFHVANRLIEVGHNVIGIDAINDYYDVQLKFDRLAYSGIKSSTFLYKKKYLNANSTYTFYKINIEEKESLDNIFKDYEINTVIHLAAQAGVRYSIINPDAYIQSNIVAFTNILECCKHHNIQHLVYAS